MELSLGLIFAVVVQLVVVVASYVAGQMKTKENSGKIAKLDEYLPTAIAERAEFRIRLDHIESDIKELKK